MVQRASAINPAVLVWARERAGLSIADVAARLGKDSEVISAWERGDAFPAYGQLEKLAESLYRRPVALFFLPEPPEETAVRKEFRTLPDADIAELGADTRYALRDAHAFQTSLRELTGGRNPSERLLFRELQASSRSNLVLLSAKLREYLGVSLDAQQRWANPEVAMNEWRSALEGVGLFVFKRSFADRDVSGFCLHDDEFPLIVVNNSTPFSRQIFTLFHELAHLLFGVSSITKEDPGLLARFALADRQLEIACNRLAAEVLVPEASFPWESFQSSALGSFLDSMAERYNVSREVILRRLRDRGLLTDDMYADKAREWASEPARQGGGAGGGSYYATQSAYLSKAFLGLAFSQFRAGRITLPEIAEHLRMRARNVVKFEDFLFTRG